MTAIASPFPTVETAKTTDKKPVVNYTPEQTEELIKLYKEGKPLADIATHFGKALKSITAKLSREGVYKKQERTTKTGEPVTRKDETAQAIGKVLQLNENDTDSLAKANKVALLAVWKALAESKPI